MSESKQDFPERAGVSAEETFVLFDEMVASANRFFVVHGDLEERKIDFVHRVLRSGVPAGAELAVAAIFHSGKQPDEVLAARDRLEQLQALDEKLKESGGQPIAWVSSKEEIVSFRDPGPHDTTVEYFLNVGTLPDEPIIKVGSSGACSIPLDSSSRFYMLGRPPSDSNSSNFQSWVMMNVNLIQRRDVAPEQGKKFVGIDSDLDPFGVEVVNLWASEAPYIVIGDRVQELVGLELSKRLLAPGE